MPDRLRFPPPKRRFRDLFRYRVVLVCCYGAILLAIDYCATH